MFVGFIIRDTQEKRSYDIKRDSIELSFFFCVGIISRTDTHKKQTTLLVWMSFMIFVEEQMKNSLNELQKNVFEQFVGWHAIVMSVGLCQSYYSIVLYFDSRIVCSAFSQSHKPRHKHWELVIYQKG